MIEFDDKFYVHFCVDFYEKYLFLNACLVPFVFQYEI